MNYTIRDEIYSKIYDDTEKIRVRVQGGYAYLDLVEDCQTFVVLNNGKYNVSVNKVDLWNNAVVPCICYDEDNYDDKNSI